jgi:hypothetical protein
VRSTAASGRPTSQTKPPGWDGPSAHRDRSPVWWVRKLRSAADLGHGSRLTFGHCKPASAGRSQGPCTSSAGDRTETVGGPSGTRAACQAGRSRRRIGARERCLSSTDVGNPGKADNRSRSDRPTRPRSMGTGPAPRSRAGAPGGFSGRSRPLFTRGG